MKRALLVAYASSDSEPEAEEAAPPKQLQQPPTKKLRTLPKLAASIYSHQDDPNKHQGRVRSQRHVDGLYSAYVYAPVLLSGHPELARVLSDVTRKATAHSPQTIHSQFATNAELDQGKTQPEGAAELHISLSRPFYISTNQRDPLKKAVASLAKQHAPLKVSFAELTSLVNDDRTRGFLAVEVGSGHEQLVQLTGEVNRALAALRHQAFYDEPRFHASIAWTLLQPATAKTIDSTNVPGALPEAAESGLQDFPQDVLISLQQEFAALLRKAGVCHINQLKLRIGKVDHAWELSNAGA